jgi:endo-1,4-beta-mannosidase
MWFLQQFAINNGTRDWSGIDAALTDAANNGFKVIATLEDCWAYERTGSQTPALDSTWFTSGYKNSVLTKELITYRAWVQEIVTRYAGDPRIAIWEIITEPNVDSTSLTSFTTDVAGLVKSIDSLTPVSLGEAVPDSQANAVSAIDCFSFHYYTVYNQTDYSGTVSLSNSLSKPWYMGELGFPASDSTRSSDMNSVLSGAFSSSNHAGGAVLWQFANTGGDEFDIPTGDASLGIINNYAT